jgi:hypothetical protein
VFLIILERLEGIEGRERKRAGELSVRSAQTTSFANDVAGAQFARLRSALARQGVSEIPSNQSNKKHP